MVYKFFDKKATAEPSSLERSAKHVMGSGIKKDSSLMVADELHKPVIKNLIKEKYIHNLKIIYGE